MPRYPATSAHARRIRAATFEAFAEKLRRLTNHTDFAPLHLGDTFLPPPAEARGIDMNDPALHRYGPVTGDPALRAEGAEDLARFGLDVEAGDVFVTPGATGGLDLALNAVLEPGDQVLVLTPTWPLIVGLLQRRGCVPREVAVDPSGRLPEPARLRERLESALTPATAGISLCNPNNPAGFIYSPAHLEAIAAIAKDRGLWVFYDAVYVDLAFSGSRPLQVVRDDLRERAFVVTSFSKSFGLAGHRIGLLAAPPAARDLIPRLITHSTYHTSRIGQRMALASLQADHASERARRLEAARSGAALVEQALGAAGVPYVPPKGGAFVFIDLRSRAETGDDVLVLLDRCLDEGVSLAPGIAFGAEFARFARLCFTATPPDLLAEGVARLVRVLS